MVIQWKLRSRILDELHQGHPGVTHMKSLARGYVWWPGLYNDWKNCPGTVIAVNCVENNPPAAPLHTWVWPFEPWQCIWILKSHF